MDQVPHSGCYPSRLNMGPNPCSSPKLAELSPESSVDEYIYLSYQIIL